MPECVIGGASATHLRRCMCPRRCRGLTESVTAHAVGLRLWSSGVPPARRQQGRVKSRHAALRSAYRVTAECRRSATMSADVGGDGVTRPLARSGWRRCSGAGMASVEDEVRRADPLSVNPGQRPGREDEEICTAGRRRCRCRAGVRHRRRSAAHLHRLLCPRRCRGLTENVTARAVGQRLWSSGVPPARRQQGRVKSRHAALRSAYRVMAECRRSATMSADVGGDDVVK